MNKLISGIHHVTALASNAEKNLDFYAGILGLRMVKKTINFDAPEVYHFYYGNETGAPGTIMTFFPYPGLVPGRHGKGQLTVTSFSVPEGSLTYWKTRLEKFKVKVSEPQERMNGEVFLYLLDGDGLGLELVESPDDKRPGFTYGNVPMSYAIRGFFGVTITHEGYERTAALLTSFMDHQLILEKGNRFRFSASGLPGDHIDILCAPDAMRGLPGSGTVHHLAFATATDETQLAFREKLMKTSEVNVTPVLDRQYFHSVYFREPGGVLFEVATLPPGFAVDETVQELGTHLKLPSWMEAQRETIESNLVNVHLDQNRFKD